MLSEDAEHTLPGALRLSPDQVPAQRHRISAQCDVILFCDCPGEASSIDTATRLRSFGFEHVAVLEGGLNGWTRAGYPLVGIVPALPRATESDRRDHESE